MNFLRSLLTALIFVCLPQITFAQDVLETGNCATATIHESLLAKDPEYRKAQGKLEAKWRQRAISSGPQKNAAPPPFTLPIVFHIVHENGPENITDADILRSLEFTNQAFANTDYYDQGTGANTQIQFCLARRSPDNQPTTGINRIVSPLTEIEATAEDLALKDLSRWEPSDYVNVWVVKEICGLGLGCGVAGYAYYPGVHGGRVDGIVMEARFLARNEASVGVLVHELGHYLGLRHTFDGGCLNDDCTRDGDAVCDTPPDGSKAAVPCSGTANSCTTDTNSGFATDQNDLFINYMDYGSLRCYSAFTPGQRDRMHFFIDGRRRSLLASFGCQEPCPAPVTAAFTGGDITVDVGSTVNFTNTSTNGDSYRWLLDGVPFATTFNSTRTFNTEGIFTITLDVNSNDPLCRSEEITQRITVVCPVRTGFELPTNIFKPDTAYTFTNTSVATTDRIWNINGTDVGTDVDLAYTFPATGLYTICLSANNGFCGEDRCRTVLVSEPPCEGDDCPQNGDCDDPFVYTYQLPVNALMRGNFSQVIPFAGGYYLAGTALESPVVVAIDAAGNLLWQQQLFPENAASIILRLRLDQEGMLIGIGTGASLNEPGGTTSLPFAFRIDPTDGNLRWARQYNSQIAHISLTDIHQPAAGANYLLTGSQWSVSSSSEDRDALSFFLDPADGQIIGSPILYNAGREDRFLEQVYDPTRDIYYGIACFENSTASRGLSAYAMNRAGNILWVNHLFDLNSVLNNRVQDASITQEGDQLIILADGSQQATPFTQRPAVNFWKIAKDDGSLRSLDRYTTLRNNRVGRVRVNSAGYLCSILLQDGSPLVWQILPDRSIAWATSYVEHRGAGFEVTTNNDILLAGAYDNGGGNFPTLARLQADGAPNFACFITNPTGIGLIEHSGQSLGLQVEENVTDLFSFNFGAEPGFLGPGPVLCAPDCPEEPTDSCAAFAAFVYGDPLATDRFSHFSAVAHHAGITYLGGKYDNHPVLVALREDGTILWQKNLDQESFTSNIYDLKIDQDGTLVGVGRSGDVAVNFRLNASTGREVWCGAVRHSRFQESFRAIRLFQLQAGADYWYFGDVHQHLGIAPVIGRLSTLDGELKDPREYRVQGGTFTDIMSVTYDQDRQLFYLLSKAFSLNETAISVVALSTDGTRSWSYNYSLPPDFNFPVIDHGGDIIFNDDELIIGMPLEQGGEPVSVALSLDHFGGLQWAKTYRRGLFFKNLVPYGEGFLASSFFQENEFSTRTYVLSRFDDEGEVRWEYEFPEYSLDFSNTDGLSLDNDRAFIACSRMLPSGNQLPALLRVPLDTSQTLDCVQRIPVSATATAAIDFTRRETSVMSGEWPFSTRDFTISPGSLHKADLSCQPENCQTEICDNQIDDDQNGFTDCEDPALSNDCCCLPEPSLKLGADRAGCFPFVLRPETVDSAYSLRWSTGTETDSIVVDTAGTYWLVATDSCGRTVSDTITLHPRPRPLLELGPDTTLCSNAVIPLLAQDGFATYEWVDGTIEKSFTAYEAGTYWVIATDSCGGVQTDTVMVFIDPVTEIDLGPDTSICPGDTLAFVLDGFTRYQWSQSSYLDCDDCPGVRFAPTQDTVLLVAADRGPGCISSDSIRVTIAVQTGSRDTVFLCAGDSLFVANDTLTTAGQYFFPTTSVACPTTDTLDLFLRPQPVRNERISICAGSSADIFGNPETEAGTYQRTVPNAGGCDSLVTIELIVNPTPISFDTLRICDGDSVLIFGNFERVTGDYSAAFPTTANCDSTSNLRLIVENVTAAAEQTAPACLGAAAGAGIVLTNSNVGSPLIRWSTGDIGPEVTNLPPGRYAVTVTSPSGCTATDSLLIDAVSPTPLDLSLTPENCAEDNTGSVLITGVLTNLTFTLDGGLTRQNAPLFDSLPPRDYLLTVLDSLGCDQQIPFSLPTGTEIFLDLPEDLLLPLGDSVTLFPTTNQSPPNLHWLIPSTEENCIACPSFTVRPLESVTVLATTLGDCPAVDSTRIRVIPREELVYVPSAFSPNGDGVNDVFRVYPSAEVDRLLSLEVFDRWGGRVFRMEDQDPAATLAGWDGSRESGNEPGVGVYVYQLKLRLVDGREVNLAGDVNLLR